MNNNNPYLAFIGRDTEGNLAMFITEYPLSPVGSRLLKGSQKFPEEVLDIHDPEIPLTREAVLGAIKALEGLLNDGEAQHTAPVFGETQRTTRRRKL